MAIIAKKKNANFLRLFRVFLMDRKRRLAASCSSSSSSLPESVGSNLLASVWSSYVEEVTSLTLSFERPPTSDEPRRPTMRIHSLALLLRYRHNLLHCTTMKSLQVSLVLAVTLVSSAGAFCPPNAAHSHNAVVKISGPRLYPTSPTGVTDTANALSSTTRTATTALNLSTKSHKEEDLPSAWDRVAQIVSQTSAEKVSFPNHRKVETKKQQRYVQLVTLLRVGIPSIAAGIIATMTFPGISLALASSFNDAGVFAVLSQDASQFVQNFLTVAGLLFSILVGQTYYFM